MGFHKTYPYIHTYIEFRAISSEERTRAIPILPFVIVTPDPPMMISTRMPHYETSLCEVLHYRDHDIDRRDDPNDIFDSDSLQRTRTLLRDAEHQLSQLDQILAALVERRDNLEHLVLKYRAALTPHKVLPPEVLSDIFLYCLPTTPSTMNDSDSTSLRLPPKPTDAPWVLGRVCSTWRSISRADSRLWPQTKISIYDRPSPHLKRVCELLPPVAKLSVTFCGPPALAKTALVPYLRRIQKLTIRMGIVGYVGLFGMVSPLDFLGMESVDLSIVERSSENDTQGLRHADADGIFKLASQLKQVKIEAAARGFPIASLGFPLGKITSLDVSGVKELDTPTVFSVLQHSHNLEDLNVSFSQPDPVDTHGIQIPFLYLPRLRSLRVQNDLPSVFQHSKIWEDLTCLTFHYVRNLDCLTLLDILKNCPNLLELHTPSPEKDAGMIMISTNSDRDVYLLKLQKLVLTNVVDTWLLDSCLVPSLRELHIQSTQLPLFPTSIRNLLIASSANKLTSFSFQSTSPQNTTTTTTTPMTSGLRQLFEVMPSATHIDDMHSLFDKEVLQDVACGALLPCLQNFRCWPETQEAFLDMVEARCRDPVQKTHPVRTLQQAFGLSQIGVEPPYLTLESHLRIGALRAKNGIVCSLYPPSSIWDL